jgi:hypothetical protein
MHPSSIRQLKWTLGNTEGAIKSGQTRETGHIGYTRRRKTQHNMCGIPKYEEKHNTICVGYHNTKKNTTQYAWDTTIRRKTQHNMCGIPQYEEKHNTT